MKNPRWFVLILILVIAGCSSQGDLQTTLIVSPTQTNTSVPSPTASPAPTRTSIPLVGGVCSPLQGIALNDLRFITSNPFKFKYPYSEGPENDKNHPAIDLGFYNTSFIPSYTGPELHTDDNFPIQSILPGKVVETVNDRYPYGNMVLIETRLDALTPEFLAQLKIPEPYARSELNAHFPCDRDQAAISWSEDSRSIYVLYAHMKNPSSLQPGDQVSCGQVLGGIGATGNSSESIEHLHLEIRIGPSDAGFGTIANYDAVASPEERYNYCIWALSEEFQPIDPTLFWASESGGGQ